MFYRLFDSAAPAKGKSGPRCPHCSYPAGSRNGTYPRRDPETNTEIRVQRFKCKNPSCQWSTFSILPTRILRIVRHTFQTLFICHFLSNCMGFTQAEITRQLDLSRGVVKRLRAFSRRFIKWFAHEKHIADWGKNLPGLWDDFTRDFSQYFYPLRWRKIASTQNIPV